MFALLLLAAVGVLLIVNFALFAVNLRVEEGRSLKRLVSELFLPLLPGELAVAVIATILVFAYRSAGLPALLAAIPVLLIFRHLAVALLRSEDRAEQLEARSIQLVGLQLGVLRTLVRALGKRDPSTGRHAAAVAAYAKALAGEVGCSEEEQDVVQTAGLLHEIGKFTWPDRILHGEQLDDEDLEIIKSHPQEGASLVGALDGYGPVAEAILYHHERIDGSGYPAGLIGREIPLGIEDPRDLLRLRRDDQRRGLPHPMSSEEAAERAAQRGARRSARRRVARGVHRAARPRRVRPSPRTGTSKPSWNSPGGWPRSPARRSGEPKALLHSAPASSAQVRGSAA